jgi:hypothetical protein
MRVTHGRRMVLVGIAAVVLISGCRADSLNFASVNGGCVPGSSITTIGIASVSHFETCPPMPVSVSEHDSASATASEGFLQVMGFAIDAGEGDASASALASYTQQILVTGPESGSGTLLLTFATSFTGSTADAVVRDNFAPSIGTGGISLTCGLDDFCPGPTTVEFAVPFIYGAPFELTISLRGSGGGEGSLQFNGSATFTSAQAGAQDTVVSGLPEPASWGMLAGGLAVLSAVRRWASTGSFRSVG